MYLVLGYKCSLVVVTINSRDLFVLVGRWLATLEVLIGGDEISAWNSEGNEEYDEN